MHPRSTGSRTAHEVHRIRGLSPTCPGGRPAGESGQTTFALQDRPGLGEGSAPCPMPLVTCNDAPQAPAGQETFDSELDRAEFLSIRGWPLRTSGQRVVRIALPAAGGPVALTHTAASPELASGHGEQAHHQGILAV